MYRIKRASRYRRPVRPEKKEPRGTISHTLSHCWSARLRLEIIDLYLSTRTLYPPPTSESHHGGTLGTTSTSAVTTLATALYD